MLNFALRVLGLMDWKYQHALEVEGEKDVGSGFYKSLMSRQHAKQCLWIKHGQYTDIADPSLFKPRRIYGK